MRDRSIIIVAYLGCLAIPGDIRERLTKLTEL